MSDYIKSAPSVMLNGDQVFVDELIRENARLTIQHEADQQVIRDLRQRAATEELEREAGDLKKDLDRSSQEAQALNARLLRAIADLHFVMAGGDPCKVCTVGCLMGTGNCKPVWRGEQAEAWEDADD